MARHALRCTRTSVALAVALSIVVAIVARAADQPSRAEEYRVKAAIVYNLAKFVDWPPEALPNPSTPLTLCVLGVDPFGSAIDDAVKGRQVGGRPLIVRRSAEVEPGCHLLFLSTSERKRTTLVLDRLGTSPVLTVGDGEGFSALGGMIELITAGDRIRFSINNAAAERAKLHLSARLLAIATLRSSEGAAR